MQSRTVPSPRDIAAAALSRQVPVTRQQPAAYDRHRWEEAMAATVLPHYAARLLGWGLAHLAGSAGYLPPGTARVERLARAGGVTGRQVRQSLAQLEEVGLIHRPDIDTWRPQDLLRPITLTLPQAPVPTGPTQAAEGAVRTEPDHPGEAAS